MHPCPVADANRPTRFPEEPFYIPRSQPHRVIVNARCLDDIDGHSLKPVRFFDGRHWEDAQRRRIAESGQAPPPDAHGVKTLQALLDQATG